MRDTYFDFETSSVLDTSINPHQEDTSVHRMINRVNVPARHRGKGIARRLMKEALADADAEGITLWLCINPYGDLNFAQLEAWYLRCGFVAYDEGWYRRAPSLASPTSLASFTSDRSTLRPQS